MPYRLSVALDAPGHEPWFSPLEGRSKDSAELPVADRPLTELRRRQARAPQEVRDAPLERLRQGIHSGNIEHTYVQ